MLSNNMKNLFAVLFILFSIITCFAQNAEITISESLIQEDELQLTFHSSKPIIVGDNMYILHIGNNSFTYSREKNNEQEGWLTFFIPLQEFNALHDGDLIWITYGNNLKNETPVNLISEYAKYYPSLCNIIGDLNKSELLK